MMSDVTETDADEVYRGHAIRTYRVEGDGVGGGYPHEIYVDVDGERVMSATELEREGAEWESGNGWESQLREWARDYIEGLDDDGEDDEREVRTDGGVDTASGSVEFTDHGGHFHSDAFAWLDLNGFHDGEDHHSVDHLITNSGSVLIRVDGTPLGDLASERYTHHRHDETGGVPAGGF